MMETHLCIYLSAVTSVLHLQICGEFCCCIIVLIGEPRRTPLFVFIKIFNGLWFWRSSYRMPRKGFWKALEKKGDN
ncbi:hypothetical protein VNO77_25523 [Canavalia gladiata]|uniref:Uncharacterized protein n=1 Tax=Canavalia gladiata TaxID=3824 RepID=A0AAN9L9L9_CANGL